MEIGGATVGKRWVQYGFALLLFFLTAFSSNAQRKVYTIKEGKMYIEISRSVSESELDSFLLQFDLKDLPLKEFFKSGVADSLKKLGWEVNVNNETGFIISKPLVAIEDPFDPAEKLYFLQNPPNFPAVQRKPVFGYNRFKNKNAFAVRDSIVLFFLRGHTRAGQVNLAGSFNDWSPEKLGMKKTDSGWIAAVKLGPGKHLYKFIVDGQWLVDRDNQQQEHDGEGNINSVFFVPNQLFRLNGFENARSVYLAGNFNGWKPKDLAMVRVAGGWQLPVYLAEGTHVYKFIVDGKWMADPLNTEKLPDGTGEYNSVLRIGKPHMFRLQGFENATEVMLVGSFNDWREFELKMNKSASGWELPYVIGPGNYEYKFKVDGLWMADPSNPMTAGKEGNSFLTIQPNYIFRLKGFENADQVFLAGDFNEWKPDQLLMKKQGDAWVFPIHLDPGKVRYKFIVDGKWILDPGNKLWEQNEHGTGNSVIWIGQ